MINLGRHSILGVGIDAVDYEAGVDKVINAAIERRQLLATCSAVHGIMIGAMDAEHRHRLNTFDLVVPDGQPVRWALRWRHGVRLADRVRGVDFMLALCQRAEAEGVPIFLYGSHSRILEPLAANLLRQYPRLEIAGRKPSAFRVVSDVERRAIAQEIRDSGAQLVFAGLGCPRQEIWAYENLAMLGMPVIGIGSAFDSNAGAIPAPPRWMQRHGLEWLFRFGHEPRRLWKRYLLLNPLYLLLLIGEMIGIAKFSSAGSARPRTVGLA